MVTNFTNQATRKVKTHAFLLPRSPFCFQLHEGEHFGQLGKSLGLAALGFGEIANLILSIK